MFCLIAAEERNAARIKGGLEHMQNFSKWNFDVCTDSNALQDWSDRPVDVLVLSRFLPGTDPARLLPQIPMLFRSAHTVLLVGPKNEAGRAYMRIAAQAGLRNTVTGDLPGDRPYNIVAALTRAKDPEIDGYDAVAPEQLAESNAPEEAADVPVQEEVADVPVQEKEEVADAPVQEKPEFVDNHGRSPNLNNGTPKLPERRAAPSTPSGILVITTANKGGVGKTTTAVAVAAALGKAGIPTALVDLDLGAPDVATFLQIKDVRGIEQLANQIPNPAQIDRLLVDANDNLHVLPGPMNKTLPHFQSGELTAILDYLRSRFPVVVCDTSPEPWSKKWLYEVFESADIALALVDQSKLSVEETKKYAPTLIMMGVVPSKIRIVLNRYNSRLGPPRMVEDAFCSGFKKTCALPKIGAIIPENWNAAVKDTRSGGIADLNNTGSHWHKLAKEIAGLAGYRYAFAESAAVKNASIFDKLFNLAKGR